MDIEYAQIVKMATRNIVNNTGQIPDVPANPRTITQKDFDALKARIAENNLSSFGAVRFDAEMVLLDAKTWSEASPAAIAPPMFPQPMIEIFINLCMFV